MYLYIVGVSFEKMYMLTVLKQEYVTHIGRAVCCLKLQYIAITFIVPKSLKMKR